MHSHAVFMAHDDLHIVLPRLYSLEQLIRMHRYKHNAEVSLLYDVIYFIAYSNSHYCKNNSPTLFRVGVFEEIQRYSPVEF